MREILFRGKCKHSSKWIYGYFVGENYIIPKGEGYWVSVEPETVGQYTGLADKNGNKIFEGDICHFYGGEYYSGYWETNYTCKIEICANCLCYLENAEYIEIIGNIYDNPELIGGDE